MIFVLKANLRDFHGGLLFSHVYRYYAMYRVLRISRTNVVCKDLGCNIIIDDGPSMQFELYKAITNLLREVIRFHTLLSLIQTIANV